MKITIECEPKEIAECFGLINPVLTTSMLGVGGKKISVGEFRKFLEEN